MTLNLSQIRSRLGDGYAIEHLNETTSTNDTALERARHGAPHGTVISADFQTAGRGRRGAPWVAPAGTGVLCSLVLRPATPLPPSHWAIVSGVGVANGLKALGFPAKIKWPNDIMLHDRKVAGILVESTPEAAVIGVGVNCHIPPEAFPPEFRDRAGSLAASADLCPAREEVLAAVIRGIADAAARVEAGSIVKVLYEWNTMNWLGRRKVRVCGPMGVVEGDGLFLTGKLMFDVFKDHGVVPMPLSSTVEAR